MGSLASPMRPKKVLIDVSKCTAVRNIDELILSIALVPFGGL
jgi:hypothetical protein